MSDSYARQHQKKQQFLQNQFSSVGGTSSIQRLTSEERKHILSDKDSYIQYLEGQLDRVCEFSLIQSPLIQNKVMDLEQQFVDHEQKFESITKVIQLLQSFAENQENENKLIKQHFNQPLNNFGKKIDNFQNDIVQELKEQIIKMEEKDNLRENQILDALSLFQNNINNFEGRIELFANQLSRDMATDIKTLANQINVDTNIQQADMVSHNSPDQQRFISSDERIQKQNLDILRDEVNRKMEFVLKEMRKNALITDVEKVEIKIKKEQKERTYLCKFVEDLTRKIDELPSSIVTRGNSRNVSPNMVENQNTSSAVQESNQFKLIKQVESDIEDLKEVVNALVEKLEDNENKKKSSQSFITKDQFDSLEKCFSQQISKLVDRYQGQLIQNIPYDESLRDSANLRSQHNNSARQQQSTLKSDQYLNQQFKSPQFEQQIWQSHKTRSQNPVLYHDDESSMINQQKYNQYIQEDQEIRDSLIPKKQKAQNTSKHNHSASIENNLGESFGLNKNSHISNNQSRKHDKIKNKTKKGKTNQGDTLDHYPKKEQKNTQSQKSIKQVDKENKQSSNSLIRGRKSVEEISETLQKKKQLMSESRSFSKSPLQQGDVSSTKSANAPKKIFYQQLNTDGRQKSNSKISLTEHDDSRIKSPIPDYSKISKYSFDSQTSKSLLQNKSPSPLNKMAEKKRVNGEKIKELFKKKKQISSTQINQSASQKSINSSVTTDKKTGIKKKK